jgi:hypothetical protein
MITGSVTPVRTPRLSGRDHPRPRPGGHRAERQQLDVDVAEPGDVDEVLKGYSDPDSHSHVVGCPAGAERLEVVNEP